MDDTFSAWLSSPISTYIQAYIKTSHVLPLHGITAEKECTCGNKDCTSPGKHPFTRHGLKDASNNIKELGKLFNYRTDLNVGILTGELSGIFVLDVDGRKNGFESLDHLFKTYGDFEPTIITQTGNGVHIWFTYPNGLHIGNRTDFLPGLDIRGQNGYIVAPPSLHVSGIHYEITKTSTSKTANAPQWLIDIIQTKKINKQEDISDITGNGNIPEWSIDEVLRMLSVLNPSMSYHEWIQVGMGLHDGGYSYNIWHNWSKNGINYEPNCCIPHWRSFKSDGGISMGTLVQMAQKYGWKPKPTEHLNIDTSTVDILIKKARILLRENNEEVNNSIKRTTISLSFDPLTLPGLIGDTVRWITKYAIKKQPELALINTLAFAGSVFGRRYASPFNTRTNIYTVGIAETASGKDHSRKSIKDLANAAGLNARIGADDIRSDSGLLRGLMNNSSQLMMIDEFGFFLQGLADEKSPHYIKSQAKILLKLYSSSNSIYNHGDYADAKAEPIIIHYPNLCIYGTSTEDKYAKALKKSAIESGELNRFITIKGRSDNDYPVRHLPQYEVDESIRVQWEQFSPQFGESLGVIVNSSECAPEPIHMKWGICDDIQYAIQCRQVDKVRENNFTRHLWGRLFENTVKIAMIFAIARNKNAPEFQIEDFDIAQAIVESSIEYLERLANNHMSETTQEENHHEIMNAIKASGGEMGRKDIMRKFRKLKKRDLDDIINGLIEQEIIEADREKDDGRGRPKTIYRIIPE